MPNSTHSVCGLTFEAVRVHVPIPHWNLRLPDGRLLYNGVAGIRMHTRPQMWADLDYLHERIGDEQFVKEFGPGN